MGRGRGMYNNQVSPEIISALLLGFWALEGVQTSLEAVHAKWKTASFGAGLRQNEAYTARDRERENGNERRIIGRTSQRVGIQHCRNTYL